MKMTNTIARLRHTAFLFLLSGFMFTANAQNAAEVKNPAPTVTYIGSEAGKPVFQIELQNPEGEETTITLRDGNGFTIYSDVVKDKTYSRKLMFNEMDADRLKLALNVRNRKENKTHTFEVIKSVQTIENVAVVNSSK